jgi:hypothetical protein
MGPDWGSLKEINQHTYIHENERSTKYLPDESITQVRVKRSITAADLINIFVIRGLIDLFVLSGLVGCERERPYIMDVT